MNEGGLCPECSERQGAHAPQPTDTVGFGRRAGARIIDLVVTQVIGLLGGTLAATVLVVLQSLGMLAGDWATAIQKAGFLFNFFSGFSSGVLGAAVGAAIAGVSPGKAMLGLRVVHVTNGDRPSLIAGAVREVGYYVDGLFFGLVGKSAMDSSPHHQRYGDRWAGTAVVQRSSLTTEAAGTPGRVALGLFAFVAVHASVMAAFVVAKGLMP